VTPIPLVPVLLKNHQQLTYERYQMNSTPTLPNLEKELHLRIPQDFQENLQRVANSYNLKKSTFARMLLIRELKNYDKSRLFA
jgi:hypothetical protein